jgi:hypothetical protein
MHYSLKTLLKRKPSIVIINSPLLFQILRSDFDLAVADGDGLLDEEVDAVRLRGAYSDGVV